MNKCLLLILLAGGFWFTNDLYAQNANKKMTTQTVNEFSKRGVDSLKARLGLSVDQEKKLDSIEIKFYTNRVSVPTTLTSTERRKVIDELVRSKEEEIKKVMSADQYKNYQAFIEEKRKLLLARQAQLKERSKNR